MGCPYISVLTVSSGRRALLRRQADALRAQTLAPDRFEWVVCLNGGDDGTRAELEGLELPFGLRVVETDERLPAGRARNACAQRTCGGILLFSDDDCAPAPESLAAHVALQESGLCVALGAIDFASEAGTRRWRPRRARYWLLNGANSAVPAVHFRAVGGFSEALAGYGGEDLELGYRLARAGVPFRVLPAALTVHQGEDARAGADAGKARGAGANAARLARMYPELRWRLGLHPFQLGLKRFLLGTGLGGLLTALGGGSVAYERAYLEGAVGERAVGEGAVGEGAGGRPQEGPASMEDAR
ncbi:MAG TPA: glycosyltransferase [Trueperaceae bacterium]|nr:glycosyltransferase [Trueperaceae bacterium]